MASQGSPGLEPTWLWSVGLMCCAVPPPPEQVDTCREYLGCPTWLTRLLLDAHLQLLLIDDRSSFQLLHRRPLLLPPLYSSNKRWWQPLLRLRCGVSDVPATTTDEYHNMTRIASAAHTHEWLLRINNLRAHNGGLLTHLNFASFSPRWLAATHLAPISLPVDWNLAKCCANRSATTFSDAPESIGGASRRGPSTLEPRMRDWLPIERYLQPVGVQTAVIIVVGERPEVLHLSVLLP